jgi:hypothetical protein
MNDAFAPPKLAVASSSPTDRAAQQAQATLSQANPADLDFTPSLNSDVLSLNSSGGAADLAPAADPSSRAFGNLKAYASLLRSGHEAWNFDSVVRLREFTYRFVEASYDQVRQLGWSDSKFASMQENITRRLAGFEEKFRRGELQAGPECWDNIDITIETYKNVMMMNKLPPPDVTIGVNGFGIVLTLSHATAQNVAAIADQLAELSLKVADAAKGKGAAIAQIIGLIFRAWAVVIKAVDQGKGVYLTMCWWSIPPLNLPPPPFFPTPVL